MYSITQFVQQKVHIHIYVHTYILIHYIINVFPER